MDNRPKFELLPDPLPLSSTEKRAPALSYNEIRRIVAETPQQTRLAICAWVFEKCEENAREGGSFAQLIYNRLGFDAGAWTPLYLAGGLDLANYFHFHEASAADEQIRQDLARVADQLRDPVERNRLVEAMFRFEQLAEAASAWSVVIRQQRKELEALAQRLARLETTLAGE